MLYDTLADYYVRLEATTKRLEMTNILIELFKEAQPDEIAEIIYLTQGKIHPDWTGEPEIGMAEKSVVEAIIKATGLQKAKVEKLLESTGDIGYSAEQALKQNKTTRFGSKL